MPKNWYFERQVERWEIAQEKLQKHKWVVLDGDDVDFIESTNVQRNAQQIANVDPTALSLISESSLDLFDGIIDWLKANRA